MQYSKPPLPDDSPLLRDDEMESLPLGPSVRLLALESDPQGGLFYQFGHHENRCLQLPRRYGLRPFHVLDMLQSVAILDAKTHQLVALAGFPGVGTRTILFSPDWGRYVDEDGRLHRVPRLPELLNHWNFPVDLNESKRLLTFEFRINIHNRDDYQPEVVECFREGPYRHKAAMTFRFPSGEYVTTDIVIQDAESGQLRYMLGVSAFPIQTPQPRKAPVRPDTPQATAGRRTPRWTLANHVETPQPPTPTAALSAANNGAHPLPSTENLSTHELLGVLSTETDPTRRWRMIEPNLMLSRPERTYPLILNYSDLIVEHTRDWPSARRRMAFSHQPAAVLMGLMQSWPVNEILAVAEDNAEPNAIMDWLRGHEIDRLLKLDLSAPPPTTVDAARSILNVDAHVDVAMVKKVWRALLRFINADVGRTEERAIHRKKDEIAKHLQSARDLLIKRGA